MLCRRIIESSSKQYFCKTPPRGRFFSSNEEKTRKPGDRGTHKDTVVSGQSNNGAGDAYNSTNRMTFLNFFHSKEKKDGAPQIQIADHGDEGKFSVPRACGDEPALLCSFSVC